MVDSTGVPSGMAKISRERASMSSRLVPRSMLHEPILPPVMASSRLTAVVSSRRSISLRSVMSRTTTLSPSTSPSAPNCGTKLHSQTRSASGSRMVVPTTSRSSTASPDVSTWS